MGIIDFRSAADWAGLGGEVGTASSPKGSLLALIGSPGDGSLSARVIGNIKETDWNDLLARWRPGHPAAEPSAVQVSLARLVGMACRLKIGTQMSQAQAADTTKLQQQLQEAQAQAQLASAQNSHLSTASKLKVKLSQVLSQAFHDNVEAPLLGQTEIDRAFARYEVIYGEGKLPPEDETPTREQMSAFAFGLQNGDIYADFSIFGPHGNRLLRKLRLSGQVFDREGGLHTIELTGPPNYDLWLTSAKVFKTLIIMFDVMDYGTFESYIKRQERYHSRYGSRCWHLQYQTDVRARSEKTARIIAEGTRTRNRLSQQPNAPQHDLNPDRPWHWVYEQLENENERWWKEEFEEPATLLLNKILTDAQVVGDDVRVGGGGNMAGASGPLGVGFGVASHTGPKRHASRGSEHNIVNGLHNTNRKGVELCEDFNNGTCRTDPQWPGWCPQDWNKAHQCNKCLGTDHGGKGCGHIPKESSRSKYHKGEFKGGGKGRGKGGGKRKY